MIFFDVETYSAEDLRKVGGRRYAEHKTTRLLSLVANVDGEYLVYAPCETTVPIECPKGRFTDLDELRSLTGRPWVAHNCYTFDRFIWERFIGDPPEWVDTLPLARAAGYPGKLDDLGKLLTGEGKSKEKDLGMKLTRGVWRTKFPARQYESLLRYNVVDVEILTAIWDKVRGYGEPEIIRVDREINDRGVYVDVDLARRVKNFAAKSAARAGEEIERITGTKIKRTDLRRTEFIRTWVGERGIKLPDLKRETVERVLELDVEDWGENVDPVAFEVLRLRRSATKITEGKLDRMIEMLSNDGRLRDMFVYWGAITGRWTGRGVQLQNLTRGVSASLDEMLSCETFDDLVRVAGDTSVDDYVSTLIRPCLTASPGKKLLIADYAAIEARGVAWVAGEEKLLDVFRRDEDPYCQLASAMFGRPIAKKDPERQIGKIGILGCGYGMSAGKLSLFAASSGIDLAAAGVTADAIVETYRSTYSRIAGRYNGERDGVVFRRGGVWQRYGNAAKNAVEYDKEIRTGKCVFYREDNNLIIRLPSGRPIVYRNCRIEPRPVRFKEGLVDQLVYDSPRGERSIYGGLLTENIVQAICRDLLAETLLKVSPVVLHVHDEIVLDGGDLDEFVKTMSTPPSWAEGFPIKVEGFESERYVKSGSNGVTYCDGRKL